MTDAKSYVRNKLVQKVPDADIRPGSALDDLMITPLSSIFEPFLSEHNKLIDLLSIKRPESMSEVEMDHLASNFFIERNRGNKITGNIRVYYDRPVSVEIKKNARFITADGKTFFSKNSYSINRIEMASKLEGSLYYAGDISVEAETEGQEYAIAANEITTVVGATVAPTRVRNPRPFTGSSEKESNEELATRIRSTFISSSLHSTESIKKGIRYNFNNIRSVEVVGAGSAFMKRDIISSEGSYRANFLGKIKGQDTYPDVRHQALERTYTVFSPISSGVNLPPPEDFEREFNSYRTIWRNDNYGYQTEDQKEIEVETFNGQDWLISGLGNNVYVNPGWNISDPTYGTGKYNPFGITIVQDENAIRMGIELNNIPARTELDTRLVAELGQLMSKVRDGYRDVWDSTYLADLIQQIESSQNPAVIYNYYPVFHRYINQNNGIAITGRFKTTADSTIDSMSYITVHRSNGAISPHDGFGIAWRVGDGSNYNVYVVDNNVLQNDIWVGPSMITQDYGINNFLQAYKLQIDSNTWYEFRLEITDDYGINAWISSESTGGVDKTQTPNIQFGELRGFGYKPVSADQGSHFGVSVAGTRNKEWFYSNMGITTIGDNFPIHMFKMYLDAEYFNAGDLLRLYHYGYGEGRNLANDTVESNSIQMYVYNNTDSEWEMVGGHDNNKAGNLLSYTVSGVVPSVLHNSDYVNDKNYLHALVTTDTINEPNHRIETKYFEVVGGEGKHLGNHADIYIDSPKRIKEATHTGTSDKGTITFQGAGPVQEIISVSLSGGTTLNDDEWSVRYSDEGKALSSNGLVRIVLTEYATNDVNFDVLYRYLEDGGSLQSFVESSNFRSPSQDNLIKVMPAYTIEVGNFLYSGTATPVEIKLALKEYINNLQSKSISTSDLVSVALANGADRVDVTDIQIKIRYSDSQGIQYSTKLINNYTIDGMGYFFTMDSDLAGVSQL